MIELKCSDNMSERRCACDYRDLANPWQYQYPRQTEMEQSGEKAPRSTPQSFGFYAIILALCLTRLLTALEATITSTALPIITAVLGGGDLFIWVINGYYLTMFVHHSILYISLLYFCSNIHIIQDCIPATVWTNSKYLLSTMTGDFCDCIVYFWQRSLRWCFQY